MKTLTLATALAACALLFAEGRAAPIVFESSGANAAAIQATVDSFRAALGTLNANTPTSFPNGRRETNWDGVPDASSAPNAFPANFFNGNVAGRARGIVFSTPGTGFQVSANAASGVGVRFSNINASFATDFATFSAERLFAPLGSRFTDSSFFLPSDQTTPAATNGFGIVFTDVDSGETTRMEFFDAGNNLLFTRDVQSASGNGTLSFLGVLFNAGERVFRVRATTGTDAINGVAVNDAVAMDDFIYGEPVAVPEPATWVLMACGALLLAIKRRWRASGAH